MSGQRGGNADHVYDVDLERATRAAITHGRTKEETHSYWAWKELDAEQGG